MVVWKSVALGVVLGFGGAVALDKLCAVVKSRRKGRGAAQPGEERAEREGSTREENRPQIALPPSANGMTILATGTDSTLADGTGILGRWITRPTGEVHAGATLVGFTECGGGGRTPKLKAWHVGRNGKVRSAHYGEKAPDEMRAWLDEWLKLSEHDQLVRLHESALRALGQAEIDAEKETDWDKAAQLQGEANHLLSEAEELEAEAAQCAAPTTPSP